MRAVLGYVEHSPILRAQLRAVPFAIGPRLRPQVYGHIEDPSPGAPDQLGLQCGRLLEVHASDCPFPEVESHISLDGPEVDPVVCEFAHTPRAEETSTIVLVR